MEGEDLQVIEDGDMEDWLKVPAALYLYKGTMCKIWSEFFFQSKTKQSKKKLIKK